MFYTLGNPEVYDALGPPLRKQEGGAVFDSYELASKAIENGNLPSCWGLSHLPAKVYGLDATSEDVEGTPDQVGARRLKRPVDIIFLEDGKQTSA